MERAEAQQKGTGGSCCWAEEASPDTHAEKKKEDAIWNRTEQLEKTRVNVLHFEHSMEHVCTRINDGLKPRKKGN